MGKKQVPGLKKIGKVWHIDKRVNGCRICQSTGTSKLEEAERFLINRLEAIRHASFYGHRPKRLFREAVIKFIKENQHKRSIRDDVCRLKGVDPFIGDLPLESVHMGSLQSFIEKRRKSGVKTRTINHGLKIVRRILNLAASEWMDEFGLTWLASAPKIKLLPEEDNREPFPLNWNDQEKLFSELPEHLREMSLFKVNTDCRTKEVCRLRWEWEVKHPEFVFIYKGKPIRRILNNGWKAARKRANLLKVRAHDLKHRFGRRLRAAGVSFEDRQDLLGHKSSRITTHYSAAELSNLINAANKVCGTHEEKAITPLRMISKTEKGHEKFTNSNFWLFPNKGGNLS